MEQIIEALRPSSNTPTVTATSAQATSRTRRRGEAF
jgi:hypothetical protein